MENIGIKLIKKHKHYLYKFKKLTKETIEKPMLEKMLPRESIINDVYLEKKDGKTTFGRQIGSYPLLIGLPGEFDLNKNINVKIVDYGYRSVTAVPYPLIINKASHETIQALPYIGKKRCIRILANRPFNNFNDFKKIFDDPNTAEMIKSYISYEQ